MGDTNSQMPKVNEAMIVRHIENALAKETGGTINEKVGKACRRAAFTPGSISVRCV